MKTQLQPPRAKLIGMLLAVATLGLLLWYLFRPELLVIDQTVDEPFPALAAPLSLSPSR